MMNDVVVTKLFESENFEIVCRFWVTLVTDLESGEKQKPQR
jgi:hypothetical protein